MTQFIHLRQDFSLIVYGSEKAVAVHMLVQPCRTLYSLEGYSQNQLRALQIIHDPVRQSLQESKAETLQKHHAKATPASFQKGDIVFKNASDRRSKLTPKFSGPFIITEVLHGNEF